jgi:hypothetical protein
MPNFDGSCLATFSDRFATQYDTISPKCTGTVSTTDKHGWTGMGSEVSASTPKASRAQTYALLSHSDFGKCGNAGFLAEKNFKIDVSPVAQTYARGAVDRGKEG